MSEQTLSCGCVVTKGKKPSLVKRCQRHEQSNVTEQTIITSLVTGAFPEDAPSTPEEVASDNSSDSGGDSGGGDGSGGSGGGD